MRKTKKETINNLLKTKLEAEGKAAEIYGP
jgi:hypothetical protein